MNHLLFLDSPVVIVIALVFLLLFGGKKIPELMKGLGKGIKSFKDGMNEVESEIKDVTANIYSCKLTRFFFGPNVDKLKTGDNCFAKSLPIPDCEVCILAGMKGKKPWYNPSLKDDNDGNVSLNLTTLGIEKDAVEIHSTHNLMTIQTKVCKLIVSFINKGKFNSEYIF